MSCSEAIGLSRGPFRRDYKCTVTFERAFHIGSGEGLSVCTDAAILRDELGVPCLPGSSIRGVLRDWCARELTLLQFPRTVLWRLLGPSPEELRQLESKGKEEYRPLWDRQGRLTVLNAHPEPPKAEGIASANNQQTGWRTAITDHLRRDPQTKAAKQGLKFDREHTETLGQNWGFSLLYEGDGSSDQELTLLENALGAMQDRILPLGGHRGVGLGLIKAFACSVQDFDRASTEGLAAYLSSQFDSSKEQDSRRPVSLSTSARQNCAAKYRDETENGLFKQASDNPPGELPKLQPPWSWLRMKLNLQFEGPMLVAAPFLDEKGLGQEQRRLADHAFQVDAQGVPYLAGSSLRGLLRSIAGRIARDAKQPDLEAVLFGPLLERSEVQGWAGLLLVGDGGYCKPARASEAAEHLFSDHVAIDRLTQFAADSLLFNSADLASPAFTTTLILRWDQNSRQQRNALALLCHTLHQLAEGWGFLGLRSSVKGHLKRIELSECSGSLVGSTTRKPIELQEKSITALLKQLHELSLQGAAQGAAQHQGGPA